MKPFLTFIVIAYFSVTIIFAQQNYYTAFGINNFRNAIETYDNGFACVSDDGGILKIDSTSQINFYKRIDIDSIAYFTNIIQTTDSGFIISTRNNSLVNYSIGLLAKFDKNGNYLWSKSYNTLNYTGKTYDIISTNNNGFYLLANGCFGASTIIKCNEFGEIIWQKHINYSIEGFKLINFPNNKILVIGTYYISNYLNILTAHLIDSSGNPFWIKSFNYHDYYIFEDAIKTSDNGFSILMHLQNHPINDQNTIIHIDSLGNLLWAKNILPVNSVLECSLSSLIETNDKNYMCTGLIAPSTTGARIFYMKTDSLNSIEWSRYFGNVTYNNFGTSHGIKIFKRNNSYFVLSRNPELCTSGLSIAKLDENGIGYCNYDSISFMIQDILLDTATYNIFPYNTNIFYENENLVFNDYAVTSVVFCSDITSISNNELRIDNNCYPNPTKGLLTIEADNMLQIIVINMQSNTLFEIILENQNSCIIDISQLPIGIYFIKITSINGIIVKKIIRN